MVQSTIIEKITSNKKRIKKILQSVYNNVWVMHSDSENSEE